MAQQIGTTLHLQHYHHVELTVATSGSVPLPPDIYVVMPLPG